MSVKTHAYKTNIQTNKQKQCVVQDMKVEVESLRKTQNLLKQEMKTLRNQNTQKSPQNRIQDMEGRLSNSEDQVVETDTSVKENVKSKYIQAKPSRKCDKL